MQFVTLPDHVSNAPKEIIAAFGTLAGAFLAISYFALTWATNRMKDWEAVKSPLRHGAPAQIVWLAGAGILISSGMGTFLFGLLYISTTHHTNPAHWLSTSGILLKFLIYLLITIPYVRWYFGHKTITMHSTEERLKKFYDPHRILRVDIWIFLLSCGVFIYDLFAGRFIGGFCGILYALFGSFGVGAYVGVIGDLMPRAIKESTDTP
jgi:hypothetical protein